MNTVESAEGKWEGILLSMGVDEETVSGKHVPCPMCGGKDRFRFDDKFSKGNWICNQCGAGDGFVLLQNLFGWDFKESAKRVDEIVGSVNKNTVKRRKNAAPLLRKIYKDCKDIVEVPDVQDYLESRGLVHAPVRLIAHPGLSYWHDGSIVAEYPALVALINSPDGEALSLHCTYIENGQKITQYPPRKIMPAKKPLSCGAAVRLYEPEKIMGVAEGIETAIAAFQINRIPIWSCLNTSIMKSFQPPEVCEKLVIFGDHDFNYAGQAAAYELARRLHGKIEVSVKFPEQKGHDFADEI